MLLIRAARQLPMPLVARRLIKVSLVESLVESKLQLGFRKAFGAEVGLKKDMEGAEEIALWLRELTARGW